MIREPSLKTNLPRIQKNRSTVEQQIRSSPLIDIRLPYPWNWDQRKGPSIAPPQQTTMPIPHLPHPLPNPFSQGTQAQKKGKVRQAEVLTLERPTIQSNHVLLQGSEDEPLSCCVVLLPMQEEPGSDLG